MSKISQYTPLVAAAPTDLLPIVDTDDFTEAPSGTTKNITVANLLTPVTVYAAPLNTLAAWTSARDYITGPPAAIAQGSDGMIYGAILNSGPDWGGEVNPVGDVTGHWVQLTIASGTAGAQGATGAAGATGQGFNFRGLYNSASVTYNPYDAVIQPTVGLCIVPATSAPFTSGTFNAAQWIILYPNQVESGSGAPSNSLGNNGDTYIDTTNAVVYGPKASGSWPSGTAFAASVSGRYLCAPSSYAPGSVTLLTASSTSYTAISSANCNTGAFTAPASGTVVVTVSLICSISASSSTWAFSLATHGSTTPVCDGYVFKDDAAATPRPYQMTFTVTGLTSGTSYTLDLLGATSAGTLTVLAIGTTASSPTFTSQGAPVLMTVQAV